MELLAQRVARLHRTAVARLALPGLDDEANLRAAANGTPKEQLLRARLDRIGLLARRLVEVGRLTPQQPVFALVDDLAQIVVETEG